VLNRIRARFPALQRHHRGLPVAYFDGPGGTQVPQSVVDAMADYLLHHNANTHWAYPTSAETDAMLLAARTAVAEFLNAAPNEVAFANNMTTLTFHLARALGRGWGPGDEVVVTDLDHHANVAPWRAIERERGITIRRGVGRCRARAARPRASLRSALGPRRSACWRSVPAPTRSARSPTSPPPHGWPTAVGALCFVDAVHLAAHGRVDVAAIGCDFLACSSYKFYGPHLGILAARSGIVARLDVPKLRPAPDTPPERLETGTQNHEGIVGALAAVEFIASLGAGATRPARLTDAAHRLHGAGQALVERLWTGLQDLPGVRCYGPPPSRPRTSTIAFTVRGHDAESVTRALVDRAVFTSHGDFYAQTIVELLGRAQDGLVRAGASCYTTEDEVDRLIAGVREIAAR
jgi:cysteine desulfurase family protein (TIGR01976 family)